MRGRSAWNACKNAASERRFVLVERAQLHGQTALGQIGLLDEAVDTVQYQGNVQWVNMLFGIGIEPPRSDRTASGGDGQGICHQRPDLAQVVEEKNMRMLSRDDQVLVLARESLHCDDVRIGKPLNDPAEEGFTAALIALQDQDDVIGRRHLRMCQGVAEPALQQDDVRWVQIEVFVEQSESPPSAGRTKGCIPGVRWKKVSEPSVMISTLPGVIRMRVWCSSPTSSSMPSSVRATR